MYLKRPGTGGEIFQKRAEQELNRSDSTARSPSSKGGGASTLLGGMMPCPNHAFPKFMQLREATQSSASNHSGSLENSMKLAPRMTVIEEPQITYKK